MEGTVGSLGDLLGPVALKKSSMIFWSARARASLNVPSAFKRRFAPTFETTEVNISIAGYR